VYAYTARDVSAFLRACSVCSSHMRLDFFLLHKLVWMRPYHRSISE